VNAITGAGRAEGISVMVAGREEIDSMLADRVNQPVLVGDPPRPAAGEQELQRFRLAEAGNGDFRLASREGARKGAHLLATYFRAARRRAGLPPSRSDRNF